MPLLEKIRAIQEAIVLVGTRIIENVHSVEAKSSDEGTALSAATHVKLREKEIDQARNGEILLARVVREAREHLIERETVREIEW